MAAISVEDWGDECRRREDRGADGVVCGEGVSELKKATVLVHSRCYFCS